MIKDYEMDDFDFADTKRVNPDPELSQLKHPLEIEALKQRKKEDIYSRL